MTLEERIEKVQFDSSHIANCCSCVPDINPEEEWSISKADAISIAKQHAEDMCKRQREICADYLEDEKETSLADYIKGIKSLIKSAPLATEAENE